MPCLIHLSIAFLFAGWGVGGIVQDTQLRAECGCQENYAGKVCLFLSRNGRKIVACIK